MRGIYKCSEWGAKTSKIRPMELCLQDAGDAINAVNVKLPMLQGQRLVNAVHIISLFFPLPKRFPAPMK